MSATTTKEKRPEAPDPYEEPMPGAGMMSIIVPLIIGGAIIAAAIILWHAHNEKIRVAEMTRIEEEVRGDLRDAYREVRNFHPDKAVAIVKGVNAKMNNLERTLPNDYAELLAVRLMIEAESEFMMDCAGNAGDAEAKFTTALGLMTHASGQLWEMGTMGRARVRIELGKFAEAEEDLNLLMERNSSFGAAYYWRALARDAQGNEAGAAADALRARALDSWPPLRDFMQNKTQWTRDLFYEPEHGGRKG